MRNGAHWHLIAQSISVVDIQSLILHRVAAMFSWIPIHREAIQRILTFEDGQQELLDTLRNMNSEGLTVISLDDRDSQKNTVPLSEIDPFTFLATFNRGITDKNRRDNWSYVKARWQLDTTVPDDFIGLPVLSNFNCWLFPFAFQRSSTHVQRLWELASSVSTNTIEAIDGQLFNQCLGLPQVSIANLTIGLFWINPTHFLPADSKTTSYSTSKGVQSKPVDYLSYREWVRQATKRLGTNYPQISHAAHLSATAVPQQSVSGDIKDGDCETLSMAPSRQFWTIATGRGGEQWLDFAQGGIITIGWDGTPDLRTFAGKSELRQALIKLFPDESIKTNDALACWQFAHDIRVGDVVFAKQGLTKLLGYGVVEGEYEFDSKRQHHRHVRKVKWLGSGEWDLPTESKMALKTLTNITRFPKFVDLIANTVGLDVSGLDLKGTEPSVDTVAYWWLNSNPQIWTFEDTPVGQRQTYTSHNDKGNKRQKYKYFLDVKPGDLVIGYVTSPQKEVVAVCRITKKLHNAEEGECIEFEIVERLNIAVSYETLQAIPDLENCEPIVHNQGSLFKLTEAEFDVIRNVVDEANASFPRNVTRYSKQAAMKGLFISEDQFDEMIVALKEKKNLVLQGAPGVGKTYVARRLSYAITGSDDPARLEMIQFHQSYSYEDFIQGFRPTSKGTFELRHGVFHRFCRRAQRDESNGRPYVFIIDEINRGNLSKIFGEIMMLIEPDKRGSSHSLPLAYAQDTNERFYIPDNVYLIGTMNTADRSLAMVDYALRRRFRFMNLCPEFASPQFFKCMCDKGAEEELVNKIITRMMQLNQVIAADLKNLGPGYQIGHSYFCPRDGMEPTHTWYRRVVEMEIVPLIREYWLENEAKVQELSAALLA